MRQFLRKHQRHKVQALFFKIRVDVLVIEHLKPGRWIPFARMNLSVDWNEVYFKCFKGLRARKALDPLWRWERPSIEQITVFVQEGGGGGWDEVHLHRLTTGPFNAGLLTCWHTHILLPLSGKAFGNIGAILIMSYEHRNGPSGLHIYSDPEAVLARHVKGMIAHSSFVHSYSCKQL